jgi:hypothetical protein
MNLVWILVALGALPFSNDGEGKLVFAFVHQQPATIPLAKFEILRYYYGWTNFALVAILTSFMSNGLALRFFERFSFGYIWSQSPSGLNGY